MTRRPTIPLPSPRDQSHRYRFHGRNRPQDRTRTPVYDQAAAAVADGVATLRIYDPIDSWGGDWGISAKEFVNALDAIGDVGEIQLQINSPGGEVFEALAIMNVLRAHPARVVARVDGLAASAASFIAASADELVMQPNSELMIHDGWGICVGNAADMHQTGDLLDHLSDNIASVYAEKSGGEVEDWRQLMLAETWFSADEAVTSGLADRIYRAGDTMRHPIRRPTSSTWPACSSTPAAPTRRRRAAGRGPCGGPRLRGPSRREPAQADRRPSRAEGLAHPKFYRCPRWASGRFACTD
jgi:ATP-dependent protease ClpP protease subunit